MFFKMVCLHHQPADKNHEEFYPMKSLLWVIPGRLSYIGEVAKQSSLNSRGGSRQNSASEA
jgi:hypothetical protein